MKLFADIKMNAFTVSLFLLICQSSNAQTYAVGADLSFMKQAEESGIKFKEDGQPKPCMQKFL